MHKEERKQAVRRVHEVIFAQVMAITHSMLELGCSAEQSREFLYRMCVIHQLSESMRQHLLKHVTAAAKVNVRRASRHSITELSGAVDKELFEKEHSKGESVVNTPTAVDFNDVISV